MITFKQKAIEALKQSKNNSMECEWIEKAIMIIEDIPENDGFLPLPVGSNYLCQQVLVKDYKWHVQCAYFVGNDWVVYRWNWDYSELRDVESWKPIV